MNKSYIAANNSNDQYFRSRSLYIFLLITWFILWTSGLIISDLLPKQYNMYISPYTMHAKRLFALVFIMALVLEKNIKVTSEKLSIHYPFIHQDYLISEIQKVTVRQNSFQKLLQRKTVYVKMASSDKQMSFSCQSSKAKQIQKNLKK